MNRQIDPRDIALSLVEDGMIDAITMLQACLNYMSWDDVRDMLESNEMLDDEDVEHDDFDDSMDGDFDSGMASAGFGTDEDYGYYGE